MNRHFFILLPLLLIASVGCATSSPRGLSWGFRKKPANKAETADREEKAEKSSTALAGKNPLKKKTDSEKRPSNPKSNREADGELAVEDLLDEARVCDDRNDLAAAEKLYLQVLDRDPNHPAALRRLANIADLRNRFDDAEKYYNRGLALRPDDPELLNDLGYSYYLQNRYEESEATLRKTLAIKPDHVYAMNNLGYLMAKKAQQTHDVRDYQVALELFQQANGNEAAQKTIEELFPNGPPQALAQTSNQTQPGNQNNPFASTPQIPPQERNPFEPVRPATPPVGQQGGNSFHQSPPQQNAVAANPGVQPGVVSQQGTPFAQSQPVSSGGQPPQLEQPIQINPTQTGMNPGQAQASQPPAFSEQPAQQQAWNTTPAQGSGSSSAMWEDAQRSAAQMSLNAMFPVSNAAGTPVYNNGQAAPPSGNALSPGLTSPNPSTGWTNAANNPVDRLANGSPAGTPLPNANPQPQNPGGWQGQPGGSGGAFPSPNPFEDNAPSAMPRGTSLNQGNPGAGNSSRQPNAPMPGSIQPVGATATDIELFEAELMEQTRNQPNPGIPQRTQNSGPVIQPATATY